MDIDHLQKLVAACLDEGETTGLEGPAHDTLEAYILECAAAITSRVHRIRAVVGGMMNGTGRIQIECSCGTVSEGQSFVHAELAHHHHKTEKKNADAPVR